MDEKEIDNYVDELCKKEIQQEDKVDESVSDRVGEMGFLWDFTVKKLSDDGICYECKIETSDTKEKMHVIPTANAQAGLVIFASICQSCFDKLNNQKIENEVKEK